MIASYKSNHVCKTSLNDWYSTILTLLVPVYQIIWHKCFNMSGLYLWKNIMYIYAARRGTWQQHKGKSCIVTKINNKTGNPRSNKIQKIYQNCLIYKCCHVQSALQKYQSKESWDSRRDQHFSQRSPGRRGAAAVRSKPVSSLICNRKYLFGGNVKQQKNEREYSHTAKLFPKGQVHIFFSRQ